MKKVILFGSLLIIAAISSCTKDNSLTPPNDNIIENTIVLSTEWQEMNKIAVKWNKADIDTLLTFAYHLKRKDPAGNEYSKDFMLTSDDTTYLDDNDGNGLTPGTKYSYQIEAINNDTVQDTSNTIYVETLSPTNHNITWEVDTLGQPGDFLYDIWGTDENNIWAIGAVNLSSGFSGIIKWDGNHWAPFETPGGVKRGIFGFGGDNIFVVGESANRGFVGHFNGSSWISYRSDYFLANGDTVYPLYSVWGSSPDNVWAVGDRGTIIHWDGSQWSKVQSPTNLILWDIWGTSADNVYALHISFANQSKLIHFDGMEWREITDQLPASERSLVSLWFDKGGTGYLTGNYMVYYDGTVFNGIDINQNASLLRVRGRNSADVFAVGVNGRVYHFNGIDWTSYPELYDDTPGMELKGVFVTETTVFAVGIINSGAIIYKGIRK